MSEISPVPGARRAARYAWPVTTFSQGAAAADEAVGGLQRHRADDAVAQVQLDLEGDRADALGQLDLGRQRFSLIFAFLPRSWRR